MDLIVLSIPLFFLGIGLELLVARARGGLDRLYDLRDSIGNMSTGVLDQLNAALTNTALFAASYLFFYEYRLLPKWPVESPLTWIGVFVGADFIYYWWHRASHRVNFLWAAHVVHHQSRHYNLSVALRQSLFTGATAAFFYTPLALLGAPPEVFLPCKALVTLYQFWIHTQLIGKLGPAEQVLNTPSHHRVHHGTNAPYIDKNYAGTFIVWDRLFGTFAEEREEVRYGTLHPLNGYEAVRANFHTLSTLARLTPLLASWRERLLLWVGPPERKPRGLAPGAEALLSAEEHYPAGPGPRGVRAAGWAFAAALAGGSVFLFTIGSLSAAAQAACVVALTGAIVLIGRHLDRERPPVGELTRA